MIIQNNRYDLPGWGDILYQREMEAQREVEKYLKSIVEEDRELVEQWAIETFGDKYYSKEELFDLLDGYYEDWEEWREANEQ